MKKRQAVIAMCTLGLIAPGLLSTAAPVLAQPSSAGSNAGAETGAEAKALYKPAYPTLMADSRNSLTVHSEKHLYKPGERAIVWGSIWSSLLTEVGGAGLITVQVTDNKGNVVTNQNVLINSKGEYSASFMLPFDAELGAYTVDSKIQVGAGVLEVLSAEATAKLGSSAKFVVVSPNAFAVKAEGKEFEVSVASNSTVSNFRFDQEAKKVSFTVDGVTGTQGVTQIAIPKAMLGGQMTVTIDGEVIAPESNSVIVASDTNSETTLEMNYHHSVHTVEVAGTNAVPEFPVSMVVMAAAIGSVVAAVVVASRRGLVGRPNA